MIGIEIGISGSASATVAVAVAIALFAMLLLAVAVLLLWSKVAHLHLAELIARTAWHKATAPRVFLSQIARLRSH